MTRRMDRVNVLLRQEISNVLATELKDPRLSEVVSVTSVDSSADLRLAKVFVSVLGSRQDKMNTLKALRSASGFIHRNMRRQLKLKNVPSLQFQLDESIERGEELMELIRKVAPAGEGESQVDEP